MINELEQVLQLVHDEVIKAQLKHERFPTQHHGWAVIKEEMDELWSAINWHMDGKLLKEQAVKKEAIQVAAMGVRFILDLMMEEKKS